MPTVALAPRIATNSSRSLAPPVSSSSPNLIREPSVTISRPIIPLGDVSRRGAIVRAETDMSPFGFRLSPSGDLHWRLSLEDWQLTSPTIREDGDAPVASFESVLDVYIGLLAQFSAAGFPADNVVRFERCALIKFLGWCGRSKRGTPTGDQYAQLERALDYLRNGNIASSQVMRQLDEINGTRTIGGNFSILQSWTKSVPLGRQRPGNSVAVEATYSREFADLLRHESGLVSFSAAKFTSLTRGISRALFRHLEGLRACTKEPTVTVDANALLAHLGSRRRDLEPSRMHEILDDAHVELYAHRIIGAHPTWSTSPTGKRVITYLLEGAPDLPKLLKQSALDYGVTGSSAEQWARGRTEQLAQVLAAAVQGILTPTKDIGRMVRNYVENSRHIDPEALPHFEPGRGLLLPGQRCVEFEYLELQYKETNDWLHAHPTIESTLRRQYTSLDRPLWVVDGLVLLAARPLCRADTLQAWKARVDDAWVKGEACAEGAD